MSINKKNNQQTLDDVHSFPEKILIGADLKGKKCTLEELMVLPEEEARRLMKETSTYASGQPAEMEGKAGFMQELHDASVGERYTGLFLSRRKSDESTNCF